jgi:hypothetical protein
MIVDAQSLAILPIADRVLSELAGGYESEVDLGLISWSNELVLHVIELKTSRPVPSLEAITEVIARVVRSLAEERWSSTGVQQAFATEPLCEILRSTVRDAERAVIRDAGYLAHFGVSAMPCTAGELWEHLCASVVPAKNGTKPVWAEPLNEILRSGPLARRILDRVGANPSRSKIREVYSELVTCLADGTLFRGSPRP